jgi:endonuclease/exonuclease/phosphatase family metal-dependent hydrolase
MTLSRRRFLLATLATAALSSMGILTSCATKPEKPKDDSAALRVITYNVFGFSAFPAKAAGDKLAVAAKIADELARYEPDLVVFQESPNSTPEAIQRVANRLGMKSILFGSGGCLLTRLPVIESAEGISLAGDAKPEELFLKAKGKFVGRAVLEWGAKQLVVYTTHLHPFPDAASAALRQREIAQLVRVMRRDQEAGLSVLVLGDMNHTPDAVEYRQWIEAGFTDSFAVKGTGVAETRLYDGPAKPPVKRIDYIFAAGPVAAKVTEVHVLWEGRFRADSAAPNPTYALSDHLPLLAVFGPSSRKN